MLNNFIYSKKKNLFIKELDSGNVPEGAIAFLEDTKEIWARGTYFNCSSADFSSIEALISGKQDNLISGTNIKTINNNSILGSGDIELPTKEYVNQKITDLIDGAPGALDTLKELAEALKNNKDIVDILNEAINSKQEKLISGENIKTINGESLLEEGDITIKNLIEVTYSELKTLRNNSQLTPGSFYRITDYETVITSLTATSAGHKFDIIVLALNENTLSEEAEICNHNFQQYIQNSLGVFINWEADFYYIAENWKDWSYDNLPDGIKALIDINTPVKRQLFNKSFKAGELRVKVAARCHRSTSKNTNYTYEIPCLGIDICDSNINENDPSTWNDHIISSDYHKHTASISGSVNNGDNLPENVEVEYVLNIPADGTYTVCIAVDDTNDILMNSSNPLRSELGVYGEIFEHLETDYFENIPVDAWDVKYCLDNDSTRFNWADTNNGKGVIYYMKDEHDNECYYDFKNILFNGYYTFSYIISNNIYDGTIKYKTCHANRIPAAHNESGVRILNNNVFKNTSASSYCVSNTFEQDCKNNTFGDSCVSNAFGNYCSGNSFGNNCQYNTFEDYCVNNTFGNYCQSNTFGVYCQSNSLGSYIIRCTFGKQCISNKFTNGSGTNLDACRMISLGDQCNSVNIYTTENPSYSSGKWLQNIDIANAMSGSIEINNINGTRIKYVTKDTDGSVLQYFESELLNKQDKLVSGTSIKTINGESILGSGDITINITEVTEKPKTIPTKNELLIDSENNNVYIGLGGKGWWVINAEKLMTTYIKNNTLYVDGNVSNETLGIDFGDVKNNNLII